MILPPSNNLSTSGIGAAILGAGLSFVYRSFYGMRIPVAAKARQRLDALDAIEGNTPTPSNAPAASPAAPSTAW